MEVHSPISRDASFHSSPCSLGHRDFEQLLLTINARGRDHREERNRRAMSGRCALRWCFCTRGSREELSVPRWYD